MRLLKTDTYRKKTIFGKPVRGAWTSPLRHGPFERSTSVFPQQAAQVRRLEGSIAKIQANPKKTVFEHRLILICRKSSKRPGASVDAGADRVGP